MTEPIAVVEYDPAWPEAFERLRDRLARALGDVAGAIEHVGSTAVPGLAAKPVIDVDIVVRSQDDVPEAIERLALLGYTYEGDLGVPGREAFAWPPGEPRHHVYVVVEKSPAHRQHIVLRDFLCAHPREAERYAVLKARLARTRRDDRAAYTQAKSGFIERILRAADDPSS